MSKKRRERKRKRRKKKLPSELNQFCWDLGRLMASCKKIDKQKTNDKSFCPECRKYFCLGYDSTDVYCFDCYYKNGCIKEIKHRRRCQKCELTYYARTAKGG